MKQKRANILVVVVLVVTMLGLGGCGGSKEGNAPQAGSSSRSEEKAADPVGEYGRSKLRKARAAQQLGEDRTEAIDKAVQEK